MDRCEAITFGDVYVHCNKTFFKTSVKDFLCSAQKIFLRRKPAQEPRQGPGEARQINRPLTLIFAL